MLEDPGTREAMQVYINSTGRTVNAAGLAGAVTSYWTESELPEYHDKQLAERTAVEWFHRCGYSWKDLRKGVYKDGHEQPDVLDYRDTQFLPRLAELEPTFVQFELVPATELTPEHIISRPPSAPLPHGVRPRVPVTHDECSFNSTDGVHRGWVHEDHIPFFNKGRGHGIMVSEYLTPEGDLKLPHDTPEDQLPLEPDGDKFQECTQLRNFGKDGYWTCDNMIAQMEDLTIPLFERRYPGHQAVFFFDNATNHAAYAEDALRTENLNLGPGGEQPPLRLGFNPSTQQPQSMQDSQGVPKGMKKILEERGLWRTNLRAHCKINNPKPGAKTKRIDNPGCLRPTDGRHCCARAILFSQPDFAAQKSRLEEVIEKAGHLVMFYPKFHCEMNWIEYYWGSCKRYARKHCTYTLAGLHDVLPDALESVPDTLVWKYWDRTQRIIKVITLSPGYLSSIILAAG